MHVLVATRLRIREAPLNRARHNEAAADEHKPNETHKQNSNMERPPNLNPSSLDL